jgi:hypothetical protein
MAYGFGAQGMADEFGNILIPFGLTDSEIPFQRWQMVSTKIWDSPGPVVVRSIILTSRGEIFVQYAKGVNDESEQPKESTTEIEVSTHTNPTIVGESLSTRDEKRSYD